MSRVTLKPLQLRYLGRRQKEYLLAHPRVLIETEHGFWRAGAAGYTTQDKAAEYTGADAYAATAHCGPEKRVRYHPVVYLRDHAPTDPISAAVAAERDRIGREIGAKIVNAKTQAAVADIGRDDWEAAVIAYSNAYSIATGKTWGGE